MATLQENPHKEMSGGMHLPCGFVLMGEQTVEVLCSQRRERSAVTLSPSENH